MQLLLFLSGDFPALAAAEAGSVLKLRSFERSGTLLLTKGSPKNAQRLGFTNRVSKVLFTCKKSELISKVKKFRFEKFRGSFAVRGHDERLLAPLVWMHYKTPKVNLKDPDNLFEFVTFKKKVICALKIVDIKHDFNSRAPKNRPGFSPVSLSPKLARALVNLSGISKGVVCDPFCGTGGILIEASLMGFKVAGYDISSEMIQKTDQNFRFLGLGNYALKVDDALKIKIKFDFVVSDLPYGRSSVVSMGLYAAFFKWLESNCRKGAVVVLPGGAKYSVNKKAFKVSKYKYYIHKSLTKVILRLEKK